MKAIHFIGVPLVLSLFATRLSDAKAWLQERFDAFGCSVSDNLYDSMALYGPLCISVVYLLITEWSWLKNIFTLLIKFLSNLKLQFPVRPKEKSAAVSQNDTVDDYDELTLAFLLPLSMAQTENVKVCILSMPQILARLGHDPVKTIIKANQLLNNGLIERTMYTGGDESNSYYLLKKGYEYLQKYEAHHQKIRDLLPESFRAYGPRHSDD